MSGSQPSLNISSSARASHPRASSALAFNKQINLASAQPKWRFCISIV